jgi:hypothetical protein
MARRLLCLCCIGGRCCVGGEGVFEGKGLGDSVATGLGVSGRDEPVSSYAASVVAYEGSTACDIAGGQFSNILIGKY